MSMSMASGSERPECTSSSSTASKAPLSLWPAGTMGSSCSSSPGDSRSSAHPIAPSRARIQLALPLRVLISPLCPSIRMGCARCHAGNVLVLKRLCTSARWLRKASLCRSR